ncbi:MAG: hypothetical protein ACOCWI_02625 [Bacillota bacterium]
MKKALNLLAIVAFCVIVAIAILFFSDTLQIYLWVEYLLLISALIVLVAIYVRFGKRTVFDECIFCLKKASKGLKKLKFSRSDKLLAIKLLNIKNYLAFAVRYLEEIQNSFDLYELKINTNELKDISEHITTKNINDIKENQIFYLDIIDNTMKKVCKEDQQRKEAILADKEKKKKELNSKK